MVRIAATIGFAFLIALCVSAFFSNYSGVPVFGDTPDFIVKDANRQEAIAVYLNQSVLKRYDVEISDVERLFVHHLDELTDAVASVVVEMLSGEPLNRQNSQKSDLAVPQNLLDAYNELQDTMMIEMWKYHGAAGRAAFGSNDVCRGPVNVAVIRLL